MSERPPPRAGAKAGFQGKAEILPSPPDRFFEGGTGSQLRSYSCAQGASRTVGVFRMDSGVGESLQVSAAIEDIRD